MEVVSPLTFARAQGGKRRFGSPIHGGSAMAMMTGTKNSAEDLDMDDCSGYGFQAAKRRKRFSHEGLGGGGSDPFSKENNWSMSPFVQARSPHAAAAAALPSAKRSRTPQHDDASAQKLQELQLMVERQAAEIQRLKSEKDAAESSANQLSSQHAKVEHENKILKRAVAIQQERGNQMAAQLEGARQFKEQAEDRIRRLEQMNLTLQYHLQANSAPAANDFMGFSPRPPDVY